MARVKLSEYDAKKLIYPALGHEFRGQKLTANLEPLSRELQGVNLVLKVDQGVKKRGKQGLVKVNLTKSDVPATIRAWQELGWSQFLVEPVVEHAESAERYLAFERVRTGWQIAYGEQGGIDVEKSWDNIQRTVLDRNARVQLEQGSGFLEDSPRQETWPKAKTGQQSWEENPLWKFLPLSTIQKLIKLFETYHLVFVEMNPVVIRGDQLLPLDVAAQIDSAALLLPSVAGADLQPIEDPGQAASERAIKELDASTPASLKFKLVHPEGHIWMLLSGGGASLVLADEVADLGMGDELANYGEYSGAPTDDDVYAYTKIILQQLLQLPTSDRQPQAMIIAGGVANFTDVAKTFRGIIRALGKKRQELVQAKLKVFVRRGGPNEAAGLKLMRDFLTESSLLGSVHGHETPLTEVVTEVRDYLHANPKRTVLNGKT
jgi:succinyl-CoA synthetase beta subunit